MRRDVLTGRRPPETEPEALIREARRRQRRRQLVIGLAVAAVLAATAAVVTSIASPGQPPVVRQPRPTPPAPAADRHGRPGPIPHSLATSVLMWPVGYPAFGPDFGPPAYLDNLSTGHLSLRHKLAFAAGDFQPYLVRTGRWLVYPGGQGTMAISDDLTGRPRVLGRTPYFAPAASPGRIWLERIRGDLGEGGRASEWQVPVRTGHHGRVITLPRDASLVAGTAAGLLLEVLRGHDFGLALRSPGGALRALPYSPWSRYGFDSSPRLVAYGTGCQDRRLFSIRSPAGTAGWIPGGAIAPGGRMIAAYAATRPLGKGRDRLYVRRLAGASRPVAVPSSAATLGARTAWSADSSWLFYQGPDKRMWAYKVSSRKIRASSTQIEPTALRHGRLVIFLPEPRLARSATFRYSAVPVYLSAADPAVG